MITDHVGLRAAIWAVAALTWESGVVVAVRMYETHRRTSTPSDPPAGNVEPASLRP